MTWLAKSIWLIILAIIFTLTAYTGWLYAEPWVNQPIREVVMNGDIPDQELQRISYQLSQRDLGRYFTVDINQVKSFAEINEWVGAAQVTRIWPDRLMVEVSPHAYVARWGGDQFLNQEWHVVNVDEFFVLNVGQLPVLQGQEQQAAFMAQQYQAMNYILAAEGLTISKFFMAERGAINLILSNGIEVLLGRDSVLPRLQQIAKIYRLRLARQSHQIESIDGRYPHGVAVIMKSLEKVPPKAIN